MTHQHSLDARDPLTGNAENNHPLLENNSFNNLLGAIVPYAGFADEDDFVLNNNALSTDESNALAFAELPGFDSFVLPAASYSAFDECSMPDMLCCSDDDRALGAIDGDDVESDWSGDLSDDEQSMNDRETIGHVRAIGFTPAFVNGLSDYEYGRYMDAIQGTTEDLDEYLDSLCQVCALPVCRCLADDEVNPDALEDAFLRVCNMCGERFCDCQQLYPNANVRLMSVPAFQLQAGPVDNIDHLTYHNSMMWHVRRQLVGWFYWQHRIFWVHFQIKNMLREFDSISDVLGYVRANPCSTLDRVLRRYPLHIVRYAYDRAYMRDVVLAANDYLVRASFRQVLRVVPLAASYFRRARFCEQVQAELAIERDWLVAREEQRRALDENQLRDDQQVYRWMMEDCLVAVRSRFVPQAATDFSQQTRDLLITISEISREYPVLISFAALLVSLRETSSMIGVLAAITQFLNALNLVPDVYNRVYSYCVDLLGGFRTQGDVSIWDMLNSQGFQRSPLYIAFWNVFSCLSVAVPLTTLGICPSLETWKALASKYSTAFTVTPEEFAVRVLRFVQAAISTIVKAVKSGDYTILFGGCDWESFLSYSTSLLEDTSNVRADGCAAFTPLEKAERMQELVDSSRALLSRMAQSGIAPAAITAVNIQVQKLRERIALENSFNTNNTGRPAPFTVMLVGEPGAGKSEMVKVLHQHLMGCIGLPGKPNSIYTMRLGSKYMDGLNAVHTAFWMDDVDKNMAPPSGENPGHVATFINIVNSTPYLANMAHLEDKGRVYIRPLALYYTTNLEDCAIKGNARDASSFWRRVSVRIRVILKKQFWRSDDDHTMDSAKVGGATNLWDFVLYRYHDLGNEMSRPHVQEYARTDDFVGLLAHLQYLMKNHYDLQMAMLAKAKTVEVCEKCKLGTQFHGDGVCPGADLNVAARAAHMDGDGREWVNDGGRWVVQADDEVLRVTEPPVRRPFWLLPLVVLYCAFQNSAYRFARYVLMDDRDWERAEYGVAPPRLGRYYAGLFLSIIFGLVTTYAFPFVYAFDFYYMYVPFFTLYAVSCAGGEVYYRVRLLGCNNMLLAGTLMACVRHPRLLLVLWRMSPADRLYLHDVTTEHMYTSMAPKVQFMAGMAAVVTGLIAVLGVVWVKRAVLGQKNFPSLVADSQAKVHAAFDKVKPEDFQKFLEKHRDERWEEANLDESDEDYLERMKAEFIDVTLQMEVVASEKHVNKGALNRWAQGNVNNRRQVLGPVSSVSTTVSFAQLVDQVGRNIISLNGNDMNVFGLRYDRNFFLVPSHFFRDETGEFQANLQIAWRCVAPLGATVSNGRFRGEYNVHYRHVRFDTVLLWIPAYHLAGSGVSKHFSYDSQTAATKQLDEVTMLVGYESYSDFRVGSQIVGGPMGSMHVAPHKFWTYVGVPTKPGWCGSPIIGRRGGSAWVLGFHVAASLEGVGLAEELLIMDIEPVAASMREVLQVPQCRIDLQHGGTLPHLVNLHSNSMLQGAGGANIEFIGTDAKARRSKPITRVKPTSFANLFEDFREEQMGSERYVAPDFKGTEVDGVFKEPCLNALRYISGVSDVDYSALSDACDEYCEGMDSLVGVRSFQPLTDAETLYGVEQSSIGGFDLSTSCGYPFFGPKTRLVQQVQEDAERALFSGEFKAQLSALDAALDEGVIYSPVVSWTLKDEAIKESKNAERKARVFMNIPFFYNFRLKQYLAPILAFFGMHKWWSECMVGANLVSNEADEFVEKMTAFGADNSFDGDVAHCDKQIDVTCLLFIVKVAVRAAICMGWTDAQVGRLYILMLGMLYHVMYLNGDYATMVGTNPSGGIPTVFFNSVYLALLYRVVFRRVYPDLAFRDHVRLMTLGDDNIANVSSKCPRFNFSRMQAELALFGKELTPGNKSDGIYAYKNFFRCTFLKRSFMFDPEVGHYMARLELSSLVKTLTTRKHSKISVRDQESAILMSAMREFFLHGRERYAWFLAKLQFVSVDVGFVKTYEELVEEFRSGHFYVWEVSSEMA